MRLKLSQPSLAGVGAGAELGNIFVVNFGMSSMYSPKNCLIFLAAQYGYELILQPFLDNSVTQLENSKVVSRST